MNDNRIENESLVTEDGQNMAEAPVEIPAPAAPDAPAELAAATVEPAEALAEAAEAVEKAAEVPEEAAEAPDEGAELVPEADEALAPRPIETRPALDTAPWYARIESASLEELPDIEAEMRLLPIDEETLKPMQAAAQRRRWFLWEGELAAITAGSENLDCAGLVALAQQVRSTEYPDVLRERSLDGLHKLFKQREQEELTALTSDLEEMDIPALQERIEEINAGPFTEQARTPFIGLVNQRIDDLHLKALDEVCAGLAEADQDGLTEIRRTVEQRDCADILKTDAFRRIEDRQDELDLLDLEKLTADLDSRSPKELLELSEKLATGSFNPKFINRFRLKTALAREAAFCRQIDVELADLDHMERLQILDLQTSLAKRELPARLTYLAERELDERLYRVDLLSLLDEKSNFDALGFEELDSLRSSIARRELSDRARADYLERLRQREHALILENTTTHAGLVEQVAAQFKIKRKDFILAADTEEYWSALQKFWGGSGMEQPRDLPVFLLDNASDLGFSGTRFWYKSGKDLAFLPLADLDHVQCMKHLLTTDLQIVRKDNTYLLTEAKLTRASSEKILDFLNECLRRWYEPNLVESYPQRLIHTGSFDRRPLEAPIPALALDADAALDLLRREYMARDRKDGNLITDDTAAWAAKLQKLTQGFELQSVPDLVWFNASGLLGSMKEGVGIGPAGLLCRTGKQPAQTIPVDQIWNLEKTGNKKILLTTTGGQSQTLELPGDLAPILLNYFRTLQLADYLQD